MPRFRYRRIQGVFSASSFASLGLSQADSDVNKVAPPSVTVPSDGAEYILPFFNVPDLLTHCSAASSNSAAALPDSLQPGALINKVDPDIPLRRLLIKWKAQLNLCCYWRRRQHQKDSATERTANADSSGA